jgi:hypothetical protein
MFKALYNTQTAPSNPTGFKARLATISGIITACLCTHNHNRIHNHSHNHCHCRNKSRGLRKMRRTWVFVKTTHVLRLLLLLSPPIILKIRMG